MNQNDSFLLFYFSKSNLILKITSYLIIVRSTMYLRYYLDENGKRVYTMKVVLEDGSYTLNAHPGTYDNNCSSIQS